MFLLHHGGYNVFEESKIAFQKDWSNQILICFPFLGFWNMNLSLFLTALFLGIASAVPKLDGSLDAQWNQWKATHRKLYGLVGNF